VNRCGNVQSVVSWTLSMYKSIFILLSVLVSVLSSLAVTPIELMKEGRFREAKALIDSTGASVRYTLIYDALLEKDAARACSLYQTITQHFPDTDADSLARERLRAAKEMGADFAEQKELIGISEKMAEVLPTHTPEPTPPDTPKVKQAEPISEPKVIEPVKPETPEVKPVELTPQRTVISETSIKPEIKAPVKSDSTVVHKEKPKAKKPAKTPKPAPAKTQRAEATGSGHWYVQVGAFGNQANADKLAKRLRDAGYAVVVVPRETSKSTLMQVRVGGYASRSECIPVAGELKEKFSVPTSIVSE
jgi:cell division septation protein DedD